MPLINYPGLSGALLRLAGTATGFFKRRQQTALSQLVLCSLAACLFAFAPAISYAQADDNDDDTVADNSIDHSPTYTLYDDVDLVSTLKFQYFKPRIVVKSVYPQLASDTDNDSVNNFNDLVTQLIQNEVTSFQNSIKMHAPSQKTVAKKTKGSNNLYIDYDTSFLKTGKNHIISVRFTTQGYITAAAQPYDYHRVINYNVDTGQEIQLSDLFTTDSNYLQTISGYCFQVLSQRLQNKDLISGGTAPTPENYANWNIKANGLLITFDVYKVAPAIQGSQTVLVPYSFLANIISPDAPVSACVNHRKRCANNSLLTGGFIDEANASPAKVAVESPEFA